MEKSEKSIPLNKGTFWWYEWALKYVPLVIMLAHWYGVFDFHSNPREIIVNVIRIFYGSWLITNEMYDADLIMIILTCVLYVYAFATRQCWRIGKLFIRKVRK